MFYYDVNAALTSNATPGTENPCARALTVANQTTAAIMGLYCSGRMATAGGLILRLKTAATAGTGGTAASPAGGSPRNPGNPAAATTWFTGAPAAGTTLTVRQIVGCSAQGGFGGWFAANPEQALTLKPNGGANGNADISNVCGLASTTFDLNVEYAEF